MKKAQAVIFEMQHQTVGRSIRYHFLSHLSAAINNEATINESQEEFLVKLVSHKGSVEMRSVNQSSIMQEALPVAAWINTCR